MATLTPDQAAEVLDEFARRERERAEADRAAIAETLAIAGLDCRRQPNPEQRNDPTK